MPRHPPCARRLPAGAALLALAAASTAQTTDTVTITANGRAQQLQRVPIAVQVVDNEQIGRLAAPNLGALEGYLPGLQVDADQPTQPLLRLRGIGSGDFGIGTDAPVGIYIDGVYAGKSGGALLDFNDIRRIELLKGPQGTLFGRNSAGGAISIVTNEPTGRFASRGLLRLGSWDTRHVQAMLNQPLGVDWALRVAATAQHSNGWQRDAVSGRDARGEDSWGTRIGLAGALGDNTRAVLSWEHQRLSQPSLPSIGLLERPDPAATPAAYVEPRRAPLANDAEPRREWRRFDGVTLRLDSRVGALDLASTTAWRRFHAGNRTDDDGTVLPDHALATGNVERNATWQQEFRVAGRGDALDWLAGASFYAEQARQTGEVATNTSSLDTLFGQVAGQTPYMQLSQVAQLFGLPGLDLRGLSWQEEMHTTARNRAWAVYGDAIWRLGERTQVTGGVRYTRDHKRFSWYAPPRRADALDARIATLDRLQLIPSLVVFGVLSAEEAQQLQALMRQNQLIAGTASVAAAPLGVRAAWSNFSPRLVIDHRFGPQAMVYASLTRGYQAGGFNTLQVNSRYQPETVTSWEVGAKGELAAFGYSIALFRYRFDKLQSLSLVPGDSETAVPSYQVTISDQRATGADLEWRWQATSVLRLFGAAEFISQRYRGHTGIDGADLSGQPVGTPLWTATLGTEVRFALAGGQARAALQGAYTGATRCNADLVLQGSCLQTPLFTVGGSRTRLDLRLGWQTLATEGGRWGMGLIVNNLADKRYVTGIGTIAADFGAPTATVNAPRRVAVELHAEL